MDSQYFQRGECADLQRNLSGEAIVVEAPAYDHRTRSCASLANERQAKERGRNRGRPCRRCAGPSAAGGPHAEWRSAPAPQRPPWPSTPRPLHCSFLLCSTSSAGLVFLCFVSERVGIGTNARELVGIRANERERAINSLEASLHQTATQIQIFGAS